MTFLSVVPAKNATLTSDSIWSNWDEWVVYIPNFKSLGPREVCYYTAKYCNKANRPTMRPQRFALCVLRYVMVVAAEAAVAEVAALVVVLVVVEESHGTILGLKIAHFRRFLKRRNGHTDIRTDIRTDGQTLL